MKLHLDRSPHARFTGYGDGWVALDDTRHHSGLFVGNGGIEAAPWSDSGFAGLTAAHFEWLAARPHDILLLGTGSRLRFPPSAWLRPLAAAGIGLEAMDIGALCRTYNVLIAEGRNVAAALVFDPPACVAAGR